MAKESTAGARNARPIDDRLMTAAEVADYLRVSLSTLYYWRGKGDGPHAVVVARKLRYWKSDVAAWLDEQSR